NKPQQGRVTLDGEPAGTAAYRQAVAWMPQDIVPMPTLTAREYVAYVGWLKGMNRAEAWQQARRALGRVNLADQAGTRTNRLSGGQLRRVGVAGALVHGARILLLDEPTAGMDPYQRRVFRDILRTLTDDVRVLLSTHDVADLAEEADHVTVMYGGSVLHHGDTGSFLTHTPPGTVEGRAAEAAYTALLRERGVAA
ncbi:ATP-binding cassette domain-containing protein, partial [Streptomyces sp. Tu 4128]